MIANLLRGYKHGLVWAVSGLLMAATAACTATVTTNTPVPVPTVSVSISPVATNTVATPPAAGAPAAMTEVIVTLSDGTVVLDKSELSAGPVRFMVKNDGTIVHALEVVGEGMDLRTSDLQPGESAMLDMNLTPGEYEAYCPVNGHRARGMTTTFMVK